MTDMQGVIKQCKDWVDKVVIKHHFCPFAQREVEKESVRYFLFQGGNIESVLHCVIDECALLDNNDEIETTLIIFKDQFESFDEFLDVIDLSEQLMDKSGCSGVYQLASFHPDYCFDDVDESDPANYTNRSPYPMMHLIREESLERAVASYPSPELIPENNVKLAREKGCQYFEDILLNIKKNDENVS